MRNTIWTVDPFTQVKSAEHMAKFNTKSISNKGAFCIFFWGGGGGQCNWKLSKNFAAWLHFKTEHALHREENKVEFFEGPFLWKSSFPQQKENWAFFWTFSFHFCLLTVNLEMQNSGLKTTAWWSRGSYFVENRHPYLRFPNMVKVNFQEHWTRVTRFNPLIWVSGVFNILCNLRLIYNKQKIKDVKASAWMRHSFSCNYTVLYKTKRKQNSPDFVLWSLENLTKVRHAISLKSPMKFLCQLGKISHPQKSNVTSSVDFNSKNVTTQFFCSWCCHYHSKLLVLNTKFNRQKKKKAKKGIYVYTLPRQFCVLDKYITVILTFVQLQTLIKS